MDAKTRYHRTFLPFYKYENSDCNYSSHTANQTVHGASNNRMSQQFDRFNRAGAFAQGGGGANDGLERYVNGMQRGSGVIRKTNRSSVNQDKFPAYQLLGGNLTKTQIVEKPNQSFATYATEWERQHSRLLDHVVTKQSLGAWPIVDNEHMVIGHYVSLPGNRFYVPEELFSISYHHNTYLKKDIPVYVATEKQFNWYPMSDNEVRYQAVVGIDGEVLTFLNRDYVGVQSVEFWLMDVIELSMGVAGLGAALVRHVVKALAKKAARRGAKKGMTLVVREFNGQTADVAKRAVAREASEKAVKALPPASYIPETGMTRAHFEAFKKAAKEEDLICVCRNTNTQSTRWIDLEYPGKPLDIKFNTDPRTGFVVARNSADVDHARKCGYWVVDDDMIARRYVPGVWKNRQPVMETMDLKGAPWPVQPGQVIHPKVKKPMVGDYDLMGVINPNSPGQNISLHAIFGRKARDIQNPEVTRFMKNVNGKMDQDRVMHGAQDNFGGFKGGATVFYPNGDVVFLRTQKDVEAFYEKLKRQTQKGAYARPSDDVEVFDELAAMRARKAAKR